MISWTSARGVILSSGESPLPSTSWMPRTPSLRSVAVTAAAAPLKEAGILVAIATCLARFSAITLLLSISIHCTISASGGEATLAMVTSPGAGAAGRAGPSTRIPCLVRSEPKAAAASAAGVTDRGRRFPGSSASCGAPLRVSLPWSTSRDVIGLTFPVLT